MGCIVISGARTTVMIIDWRYDIPGWAGAPCYVAATGRTRVTLDTIQCGLVWRPAEILAQGLCELGLSGIHSREQSHAGVELHCINLSQDLLGR
jgi:hypothetical protein